MLISNFKSQKDMFQPPNFITLTTEIYAACVAYNFPRENCAWFMWFIYIWIHFNYL